MRLALTGDVMLGRLVNDHLKHVPPAYPWGDTLALLLQADARIVNLECAITDRGQPWRQTPKVFHFRSDAKNTRVLSAANIDAASLANNHALDYGYDGLEDTLDHLDAAGIHHAGAGMNQEAARAPAMFTAAGMRLGLLSFTDNEEVWEAGPNWPGTWYVPTKLDDPRAAFLLERIESLKRDVDLLVVAAHWGGNWGRHPPHEHVDFGRALLEHGADVVFGHSCHVTRAVEPRADGVILYSTGDFIDDYRVEPQERNDRSFIFQLDMQPGRVEQIRLLPTVIREFQARRAPPAEAKASAERMVSLCAERGVTARWDPEQSMVSI